MVAAVVAMRFFLSFSLLLKSESSFPGDFLLDAAGGSDGTIYSCQSALKYSRRCSAMETNDGTELSLLDGQVWYLMQFAKIRHISSWIALVFLY